MATSYAKMTIIGHLGGDPEMRYTQSGAPVTSFSVAVNARRHTSEGNGESTQWFRVSCWNRLAEVAAEYLRKGRTVYVEGSLQVREYSGRDGQNRVSLDLTARELQMLDGRPDGAPEEKEESAEGPVTAPSLDEIPF